MTLWTPGSNDRSTTSSSSGVGRAGPGPGQAPLSPDQEAEAHEIAAELQAVRDQLSQVPAAVVIANHAMGCYELAAIHLSHQPPRLEEAQLAIDGFGALLGAVEGRLGADEATLNDALAQIRMAFVHVKASAESTGDDAPAAPAAPGGPEHRH